MNQFWSMVAGAAISTAFSVLGWLVVVRRIERSDRAQDALSQEIRALRDERVKGIETDVVDLRGATEAGFAHAAVARKEIYEGLTWIKTHFVHASQCRSAHEELARQMERFAAASADLVRVEEQVKGVVRQAERLYEQQVAMIQDVARLDERRGGA